MEQIVYQRSGEKDLVDIQHLNLSKLNLAQLDENIFQKCENLFSLDVSKNKLKDLSCLKCLSSTLRILNFEDNSVKDISFLSNLTSLESLYFDGNPLNAADRYIAVDQIPSLRTLNGKSCDDIRKSINEFMERLTNQGMLLYESKFKEIIDACCDPEEQNMCQKQFLRELLYKISSCNKVPQDFVRYKVKHFVENKFIQILQVKNRQRKPSDRLDNIDQTALNGKSKRILNTLNQYENSVTSGSKLKKQENGIRQLDFEPEVVLRIHSDTASDTNTPVWGAAFEPDLSNERKTTDTVATCGGNIVCFLNCTTGYVQMKYKEESPSENFFSLSWTILPLRDHEIQKATVLAVAGNDKKIHLILPSRSMCFSVFKAHSQAINTLYFHPTNRNWLLSGSKDKTLHLWEISSLQFAQRKNYQKKLMTFDANEEILRALYAQYNEHLFVATSDGLLTWNMGKDIATWTRNPTFNLIIPELCKSEHEGVIDGMVLISTTVMAVKVSQSGKIFLWDFSTLPRQGKQKTFQILPIAVFVWSECLTDYIYMDSCIDAGLLACGDNSGRIWLYNVSKYSKRLFNSDTEIHPPDVVFPWPKLTFEKEEMPVSEKIIVNSIKFNQNGEYLVACTDSNLISIWRKV